MNEEEEMELAFTIINDIGSEIGRTIEDDDYFDLEYSIRKIVSKNCSSSISQDILSEFYWYMSINEKKKFDSNKMEKEISNLLDEYCEK